MKAITEEKLVTWAPDAKRDWPTDRDVDFGPQLENGWFQSLQARAVRNLEESDCQLLKATTK